MYPMYYIYRKLKKHYSLTKIGNIAGNIPGSIPGKIAIIKVFSSSKYLRYFLRQFFFV